MEATQTLDHNMVSYLICLCVREKGKWSSEGGATFGFSFVLVVLAAGVFMIDIAIIRVATRDPYKTKKVKT